MCIRDSLKEEQTATYSIEIWKRFRKWGGIPTGITQNVKDLLRSPEIANILENSDFIYMLNQASEDRAILAQRLNISPHQLSYVTNSGEGEGLQMCIRDRITAAIFRCTDHNVCPCHYHFCHCLRQDD